VELKGQDFTVAAGQQLNFTLTWCPSRKEPTGPHDVAEAIQQTEAWWRGWARQCTYRGPYTDAVLRSAITLEALTSAPTGGIVAAPTTSLPE
jgi:GH15 family glucan-1,4-alpha-glucosidase